MSEIEWVVVVYANVFIQWKHTVEENTGALVVAHNEVGCKIWVSYANGV